MSRHFTNAAHLLARCEHLPDLEAALHSRLCFVEGLAEESQTLAAGLARPYLAPAHPLPDLPHPALSRTLTGHTGGVNGCAFSPDGHSLVSASYKTLKLWDLQSGQARLTLTGHRAAVLGCAFSPDGRSLVSTSGDKTLKLWDLQSGHCLATLPVEGALYGCAWSPDGQQVVVVGDGGSDVPPVWRRGK